MYILILAGGGGTRLWPISRRQSPKQVQPLIGDETLLQATFTRVSGLCAPDHIFVATNDDHAALVREQLPTIPAENIICEPAKRDTASAIGFAALVISNRDPGAIIVTVNADAYIANQPALHQVLTRAEQVIIADPDRIALIGVRPTYPETGYGYMQVGERYHVPNGPTNEESMFIVKRFVEKPDRATAEEYVKQGEYLWNPALFVFKATRLLELFTIHLPAHAQLFQQMLPVLTSPEKWRPLFLKLPAISIDYGIMEKVAAMVVLPEDLGWCDIGHWLAIKQVTAAGDDNAVKGLCVTEGVHNSLVYNYTPHTIVAAVGMQDMIVVVTDDVVLVCGMDHAQDVKKVVSTIESQGLTSYL